MRFTTLFPALGYKNYRLFWSMQWIALVGFWVQLTAQQWLVYEMTGSAFKLGLLSAMQFTPSMLLSLFLGFWIDRHSKRKILAGTQFFYMLQALSLAILLWCGAANYYWLLFFAVLLGTIDAVDMPTRLSFLPCLVEKKHLHSAMALNSANFNITRMAGPLLAAVLLAHMDYGTAFFVNAVSLLPIFIMYLRLRVDEPIHTDQKKSAREEIRDGFLQAKNNPLVMGNLCMVAIVSGLIMNFGTYGPLFSDRILHRGVDGFGTILFAIGCGSLTSGLLSAAGRKRTDRRSLVSFAAATGILMTLVSRTSSFWLSMVLFAAIGFFVILFLINGNTSIQLATDPAYLGRIMSLYTFVFLGSAPFGSLLVSSIIEVIGTADGLLAIGLLEVTLLSAVAWIYRKTKRMS